MAHRTFGYFKALASCAKKASNNRKSRAVFLANSWLGERENGTELARFFGYGAPPADSERYAASHFFIVAGHRW